MRKALMIGVLLGALPLGACSTVDGKLVLPSPAAVDPVVADARAWADKICGVLPTAGTVLSILATFTGGGAIVDIGRQIGMGVCGALTNRGARRGMGPPKYRGVVIRLDRR